MGKTDGSGHASPYPLVISTGVSTGAWRIDAPDGEKIGSVISVAAIRLSEDAVTARGEVLDIKLLSGGHHAEAGRGIYADDGNHREDPARCRCSCMPPSPVRL
jgi:hypothetical protein